MATREEIREEIDKILTESVWRHRDGESFMPRVTTELIIQYLHDNDVVIRVAGELPDCASDCNVYATECAECDYGYSYRKAQVEMKEAGYVVVEPLEG